MRENFQLMILLNPINGIRNRKEFDLTDSFKGDIFISLLCVVSEICPKCLHYHAEESNNQAVLNFLCLRFIRRYQ